MEVHEVEDYSMREVSEADVVVLNAFTCIDHLDKIEIILSHGLEVRYLHVDSLEVQLCSFNRVHINELISVSWVGISRLLLLTSGEDIFTLRAFSSRIRWSVT